MTAPLTADRPRADGTAATPPEPAPPSAAPATTDPPWRNAMSTMLETAEYRVRNAVR
jgi:hypothetical protein